MVQMAVDPNSIVAPQPQPAGWYKLKLVGFKPKETKAKDGVNYNAQFEVVNPDPKSASKKPMVFHTMSTKMGRQIVDILHGMGFHLEPSGELPGQWIPDPANPNDVSKLQYKGPLIGRTLEAELAITNYNGNERNEIRQVRCQIQDCGQKHPTVKHNTNMLGKAK